MFNSMFSKQILATALFCLLFAGPGANGTENQPKKVDFKTQVRPILSNRCFACHGPDEGHVESGLRLDLVESATAPADSGAIAIVPGKVNESELIRRILSSDESERMPPPHFAAKLTELETQLIRDWISAGANYSKHWSFDSIHSLSPNSMVDLPTPSPFPDA